MGQTEAKRIAELQKLAAATKKILEEAPLSAQSPETLKIVNEVQQNLSNQQAQEKI